MQADQPNFDDITNFLESVELPKLTDISIELDTKPIDLKPPVFDTNKDQSILVGSQVAGFSADVPKTLRPMISNVFLLAQLVADKKIEHADGSALWYNHYLQTMKKMGWVTNSTSHAIQHVQGSSIEVHKEIIPIISAVLGPAAVASSSIVRILKGLHNINKDLPWITLFNRKSQRASANQFQFSQTTIESGNPVISIVAFELNAQHSVTQVLFFKFSSSNASLKYFEQKLNANTTAIEHSASAVQNLVFSHINQNIADIAEFVL